MNNTKVFLRRTGRYELRTQHDVDATMHTIRVSGTVFQDLELEEIEPFRAILGTYHPSETEHSDDKLGLLNMYCTVPDNFQYLKAYFQGDSSRFDYRVRVNMLSYPAKHCKEVLGSNGREHKYYFEIQTV